MSSSVARASIRQAWVSAAVALILLATLTPQGLAAPDNPDFFAPLTLRAGRWRDVLQNVLLYAPLGVVCASLGGSLLRTAMAGAALSLTTELLQFVVPGRDPAAADVLVNVAGATAGWLGRAAWPASWADGFAGAAERWVAVAMWPGDREARRLFLGWAVGVSGLVVATTWLLSPALPPPFYYVVSTPLADAPGGTMRIGGEGAPAGSFAGLVDDVRVYSRALTADEIRDDMPRPVSVSSREPDLVAAYAFDSEGVLVGSPGGVSWAGSGKHGGALAFDGRSTGMFVPDTDALDLRRVMTVEAWVRPQPPGGPYLTIVENAGADYVLRASSGDGALFPSVVGRFGQAPRLALSRRSIPPDAWTHLAATYDAQVVRLYVDGRLAASLSQWSTHRPVETSLDGLALPAGPVEAPASLRSQLLGNFVLDTTLTCGVRQRAPAPVFLLIGVQSIEVLAVDAAGAEVQVRFPTWADRLGLRAPPARAVGVLEDCLPGDRVAFELAGPLRQPTVVRQDGRPAPVWIPRLGAAWALALDSRVLPVPALTVLSIGFVAGLAAPFGFWARRAPATVAGAVLVAVVVCIAAVLWSAPVAGWPELTGACLGVGVGALGARAQRTSVRSRFERAPS